MWRARMEQVHCFSNPTKFAAYVNSAVPNSIVVNLPNESVGSVFFANFFEIMGLVVVFDFHFISASSRKPPFFCSYGLGVVSEFNLNLDFPLNTKKGKLTVSNIDSNSSPLCKNGMERTKMRRQTV